MTVQVNIYEAKSKLSKLINRVIAGEEVIVAKSGKPVAKIVPLDKPIQDRKPGSAKGKMKGGWLGGWSGGGRAGRPA